MITKQQTKELDTLLSKAILNIYPKCVLGGGDSTEPHHIFGKGKSVRWLVLNSVGINRTKHTHTIEMHRQVKEWFINKFGGDAYDELEALSKKPAHGLDYEEIKNSLLKYVPRETR